MSDPIVFISHFQIREGALDAYRQLQMESCVRDLEAAKPRTQVFLTYVDTAGSQMTAVHVFADAESMDLHFEGSDEPIRRRPMNSCSPSGGRYLRET